MAGSELNVICNCAREGLERCVALTPLPFYDPQKRIPRGLESADV